MVRSLVFAGCPLILLLSVCMIAGAGDLPKEFAQDLADIEDKLAGIERDMASVPMRETELGLAEADDWIEDLRTDANLAEDDPILVRLKERSQSLAKRANLVDKEKADQARMPKEKAKPRFEELEELLEIDVDLKAVSFKRDIAPMIQNRCLGCHNNRRSAGDFDASTFELFMEQIEPGKPEESHILNLVSGREQPRMPQGNAGFSTDEVDIWTAWVQQGARFDGTKRTDPITAYLVDADAQRREKISKLPIEKREELHRMVADLRMEQIKPQRPVASFETPNILVHTTRSAGDAEYFATLAEAILEEAVPRYEKKRSEPVWPGRFVLFVFQDRYDFVAFARLVDSYEPSDAEFGYSRNRPELAYLAMTTEIGDRSPDLAVAQQFLAAYFRQLGQGKMPEWATYGSALAASKIWDTEGAKSIRSELESAARWAGKGTWSASLFDDKLPWVEAAPLATSLFTYIDDQDSRRLSQFQTSLADGTAYDDAIQQSLGVSRKQLEAGWYQWLRQKHGR